MDKHRKELWRLYAWAVGSILVLAVLVGLLVQMIGPTLWAGLLEGVRDVKDVLEENR